MQRILKEIQDGTYARAWVEENKAGRPWFTKRRAEERAHLLEKVGRELRAKMPFLDPIEAPDQSATRA
jgi:ketol-acid reductoisomerase